MPAPPPPPPRAIKPPPPPKPGAVKIPKPPNRYRLLEDHYSYFSDKRGKRILYGSSNDEVKEISISDPVVIVEAKDGNRYPIQKSKLIKI